YFACGIGSGQFGLDGKHTGAGPPSDGNASFAFTCGIGSGQFGDDGKQTGAGPPSENPTTWVFEAAIPEIAPRIIRPASAVVAIDFMAVVSLSFVMCTLTRESRVAQCTAAIRKPSTIFLGSRQMPLVTSH